MLTFCVELFAVDTIAPHHDSSAGSFLHPSTQHSFQVQQRSSSASHIYISLRWLMIDNHEPKVMNTFQTRDASYGIAVGDDSLHLPATAPHCVT